jgi:3-oxoacyl-[acyl-carrier-protein] synthase-1
MILVEKEGDATVTLRGVGESSDGHHMSTPHPDGLGACMAMRAALDEAGLDPWEVDYVNAHGTGTLVNDAAEARAISTVLGDSVPVVSTKAYTGHMLGAAGATEAIFAMVALEQGWIPASLGASPPDPELTIHVNQQRSPRACRVAMSNSFGFGGSNVSVVLGVT